VGHRSAGSFASARITAASIASDNPLRCNAGLIGAVVSIWLMSVARFVASNGSAPVSISYAIIARA
jgi:hypothetical protein